LDRPQFVPVDKVDGVDRVRQANIALQPTVGAATVRANRRGSELAPPSAERGRYVDIELRTRLGLR